MRQVVSDIFPTYSESFESFAYYGYDDIKGIPSFGIGQVLTLGMALSMKWHHTDGTPATHADIEALWAMLSSPQAKATASQGGAHYAGLSNIRLDKENIESSFASTLARFEGQLRRFLANWDGAPANPQLAALSHAWAFGGLFPASWPSWTKCFNCGDWAGCAAQDMPSAHEWTLQNDSFHRRIRTEQALLVVATSAGPDQILGFP